MSALPGPKIEIDALMFAPTKCFCLIQPCNEAFCFHCVRASVCRGVSTYTLECVRLCVCVRVRVCGFSRRPAE